MKKILFIIAFAGITFAGQGFALPASAQTYAGFSNCPALTMNLYRGMYDYMSGGQVSLLQQFLSARGYYQPVTGYFGSITSGNVAQFQRSSGVYATGFVGPLTRAAISNLCGSGGYPQSTISVTGINGPNLLSVGQSGTWSLSVNAPSGSYLSMTVNWGDQQYYAPSGLAMVSQASTFTHAYAQAGTYTITFSVTDQYGNTNRASTTVVVGGGVTGGLTVTSPVQGQIVQAGSPLTISWSYPVTPGSASMVIDLYTAGGSKVGTIVVSNSTIGSYTWSVPPYPNTRYCTLQYPNGLCGSNLSGQYYVQVSAVSGNGLDQNATVYATGRSGVFTITQTAPQSGVSASPLYGQAPLSVTFSVGSYAGLYAIQFGDGTSASLLSGLTTHTYYNHGTYTAQLTSDASCLHSTPACAIATQLLGSLAITAY